MDCSGAFQQASTLDLEVFEIGSGHVIEGVLRQPDGYWYPDPGRRAVLPARCSCAPIFAHSSRATALPRSRTSPAQRPEASEQAITNKTFSDKWTRFKRYGLEPEHESFCSSWYCKKLGLPDVAALEAFYGARGWS